MKSQRLQKHIACFVLVAGASAALMFGCTSRSVVAIDVASQPSQSSDGPFRITRVNDRRTLPPELRLSASERSRAVAAYGGNVELLASNQTVTAVVEALVHQAFRKAEDLNQRGDGGPVLVEVDIEQFWGAGYVTQVTRLGFIVQLKLTAPIEGFQYGKVVTGSSNRGTYYPPIARLFGGPRTGAWKTLIDEGCADLVERLAAELRGTHRGEVGAGAQR